ncbi:MAG: Bax inhibitor-1/YccA family protein [Sedimentisphaerales bacterium]|nr:Bax inhibitor-1/YccA family protein [Sedimentisphaerales bacterium]
MEAYGNLAVLTVAQAEPDTRAAFIRRTYAHLAGAVAVFVGLEAILLKSALAPAMMNFISANRYGWLMILGAFILAGWMGRSLASSARTITTQYLGLGFYVLAEAIIFVPILYIAAFYSSRDVLPTAAILTGLLFAGLTTVAFTTRKDFSFLRGILTIGGFVALGLIVCATIFGFGLGLIFSVAMVGLASAAILYDTSKIIHHYGPDQHVAASLELFASVALLFWYVLRIVMSLSRR